MPIVFVYTNLGRSQIADGFMSDVTNEAATILAVESKGVQLLVNSDCLMSFGGTIEPTATVIVLAASGQLGPEKNDSIAAKLTSLFVEKLNIPIERIFMRLNDVSPAEACYMGTTLATATKTKKG